MGKILIALILLYVSANFFGFVVKIKNDLFFYPFHFLGGVLIALLIYTLTGNTTLAFIGTLGVGILWEVYEWLLWKHVLKKKEFKPKNLDTLFDIMCDTAGALVILSLV